MHFHVSVLFLARVTPNYWVALGSSARLAHVNQNWIQMEPGYGPAPWCTRHRKVFPNVRDEKSVAVLCKSPTQAILFCSSSGTGPRNAGYFYIFDFLLDLNISSNPKQSTAVLRH